MRIGSDIRSDVGFRNELAENKYKTFMIDEIGLFMCKISSERATESQKAIKRALLDGFTGFGDAYNVEAKIADKSKNAEAETLKNYAPQVFGVTTGATLWESFNGDDAASGFLNRLIILSCDMSDISDKKIAKSEGKGYVPPIFEQWNKSVILRTKPVQRSGMYIEGMSDEPEEFKCIPMGLDFEASAILEELVKEEDKIQKSGKPFCQIYARLTEITSRVAMIVELASNAMAFRVSERSTKIAYDLVKTCLDYSYQAACENIAESEDEAYENKVMKVIIDTGFNGIHFANLREHPELKGKKSHQTKIIKELKESYKIRAFMQKTGKRGAQPKIAIAREFFNENAPLPDGWVEI